MKRFIKDKQRLLLPIAVMIFALIGAWVLNFSKAETPVPNANCGAKVTPYNYQVPFGNAVWNQPVCNLPRYANSSEYVDRLLKWGILNTEGITQEPNDGYVVAETSFPEPTFADPEGLHKIFAAEVYYVSDANTTTKVQTSDGTSNLDGGDISMYDTRAHFPDAKIPWNSKWRSGEGGDNAIVVLDDTPGPTQGRMYKVSGYKRDLAAIAQCGPIAREERICTYNANVARDLAGNYVDYRTYEGFLDQRGVGLSSLAGMVMPEEIKAGEIRHALGLVIPNTAIGPVCSNAQRGTSAEGFTCGVAFAPASKHEWGSATDLSHATKNTDFISTYTLDKTIPEGIRYALNITDAEIETWLNSNSDLSKNSNRRNTARIIAKALRDYGMMVVDTNSNRAGLQLRAGISPESSKLWKELGMGPDDGRKLLTGLITKDNLYVVDPPTLTCADGTTSKYSCKWASAQYSASGTNPQPTDTTKPIVSITSPANNSVFSQGVVTVNATASDNVAVSKVEFYVDNQSTPMATDTSAPYSSGDSINLLAGAHTIKAIAQDSSGNRSNPATISITVSQPQVAKSCDFDSNDIVEIADLARVLSNWKKGVETNTNGDCSGPAGSPDGYVSLEDLAKVLAVWKK